MKILINKKRTPSEVAKFCIFVFLLIFLYSLPFTSAFAQEPTEYQLLEPLPGYVEETSPGKTTGGLYIAGIFNFIIAVAGGMAVLVIIFGGLKYMSTDAFSGKNEAKSIIEHAIWGLLLALSAWIILNTINPDLVNFNLNPEPIIEDSADTNLQLE
jgi:hypothetical protein